VKAASSTAHSRRAQAQGCLKSDDHHVCQSVLLVDQDVLSWHKIISLFHYLYTFSLKKHHLNCYNKAKTALVYISK
jgi:hypothetical protein